MQLKCQSENCCGELIKAGDLLKVKTEFGFSKAIEYFICKKCHTRYIACPECNGDGFISTIMEDYDDCDNCGGSGIIAI